MHRRLGTLRGTVLRCPDGHSPARVERIGDAHFPVECTHARTHAATAHWLYLLPDPEGATLVVECGVAEVRHIRDARLTLAEIRAYLGVPYARARDLAA